MAKGRRPRRGKQQSESAAEPGELADRIEALRGEVREARADAERRARGMHDVQQPGHRDPVSPFAVPPVLGTGPIGERPRPDGSRRRAAYAVGAVAVLAGAGVVAGVLASSSGEGPVKKTPAVPVTSGGRVSSVPVTSGVPATSGGPASSGPATTVPVSTVPPGTSPATTPPVTGPPASTPPPGRPPTPESATVTVATGDSFWSIAARTVRQRLGIPPTTAEVSQYWSSLVAANTGRLPVSGDPDLIYPGTTLVLP